MTSKTISESGSGSQMKHALSVTLTIALAFATALTLQACSESADQENAVTSQGTIDLNKIKLGTPDQVFQEASVTFVRDPSAQANSGGKRQYLSRGDVQGGQYMAQIKNGSCFEISVLYKNKPVSREAAEAAMKKLLPEGAPPQSRVDEPSAKSADALYFFGDEYLGDISFVDKNAKLVQSVKLINISGLKQAQADSQSEKEALKPLVTKARKENESSH